MRFYTKQECEEWLTCRNRLKPDAVPGIFGGQIGYPPSAGRMLYFAEWIARNITYRQPTLLWVTE